MRRLISPNLAELRTAQRASADSRYWRDEGIALQIALASKLSLLTTKQGLDFDLKQLLEIVGAARTQASLLEEHQISLRCLQDEIRAETSKDMGVVNLPQLLESRDRAR